MTRFCASCGSPVEDTENFCTKCGAQMSVAPAAARAVPSTSPAPAKKGGPLLKVLAALAAILALFIIVGVAGSLYFVHKAKEKVASIVEENRAKKSGEEKPKIRLEEGGAGSKAAMDATIDVPAYPGSTPTKGNVLSAGPVGAVSSQEYETADSVEKVFAFYKEKFGSKIRVIEDFAGKVEFTYMSSTSVTTVTIAHDSGSGKTKITIGHMGK